VVLCAWCEGRWLIGRTANYSMWYGVLLWWWVGGQEGGSVVLCAWCEGRWLTGKTAN
jgi:hypothetical protein